MDPVLSHVESQADVIAPQVDIASSLLSKPATLRDSARAALKEYFINLEGAPPANLYELFLGEVELPLLEIALGYTNHNQSAAADLLNLSRGTLRKKMQRYGLLKQKNPGK